MRSALLRHCRTRCIARRLPAAARRVEVRTTRTDVGATSWLANRRMNQPHSSTMS